MDGKSDVPLARNFEQFYSIEENIKEYKKV